MAIEPDVLRSALRFQPAPPRLRVSLDPDVLYEDIASAFSMREQPRATPPFACPGAACAWFRRASAAAST